MVSQMQLKLFRPMIPKSIQLLFEEGITNNDYLLKLCGSGGGGFMLGFSNSHKKQHWETNKFPADPIYLFVSKDDKSIFL
jgi:mevalonate kinase